MSCPICVVLLKDSAFITFVMLSDSLKSVILSLLGITTCICFRLASKLFFVCLFDFAVFIAAFLLRQLLEIAKCGFLQCIHLIERCIHAFSGGVKQLNMRHLCSFV